MKKITALWSAALLTGGLTTAALAEQGGNAPSAGSAPEHGVSMAARGETDALGTISKIDRSAGLIEVKTPHGTSAVYVGSQELGALKEGDRVRIDIDPALGSINKIDQNAGMMEIKTSKGTNKVYLPATELKNFKQGEQVAVNIANATGPTRDLDAVNPNK
jgi:ribosomal protein L21E